MRQALEMALEALQDYVDEYGPWNDDSGAQYVLKVGKEALAQPEQWGASAVTHPEYIDEQKAKTQELRSMLAQPEQEPVAKYSDIVSDGGLDPRTTIPPQGIYYTPPQRKPLTDEQLKPLIQKAMMYYGHNPEHWTVTAGAGFCILARAIEAAHGIKE